jgi:hypothetical protein
MFFFSILTPSEAYSAPRFFSRFPLRSLDGGVDFTDTSSAISLTQFVLGLRTHFEDIKGATSIEAVDSLTPFQWRSDVYDSGTQFWRQSDEQVASWIHQVHSYCTGLCRLPIHFVLTNHWRRYERDCARGSTSRLREPFARVASRSGDGSNDRTPYEHVLDIRSPFKRFEVLEAQIRL